MQCDHDLNGTCVNHIRDFGEVIMEQEDTICFDHIKGTKVIHGQTFDAVCSYY